MENMPNDGSDKILESDSRASSRTAQLTKKVEDGLSLDNIIKGLKDKELIADINKKRDELSEQTQGLSPEIEEDKDIEDRE